MHQNLGIFAIAIATFHRMPEIAAISGTSGGPVPVPLLVGAPGKPLLRVLVAWDLVCDLALRVCDIVWLFVMVRVLSGLLSSFSCL